MSADSEWLERDGWKCPEWPAVTFPDPPEFEHKLPAHITSTEGAGGADYEYVVRHTRDNWQPFLCRG